MHATLMHADFQDDDRTTRPVLVIFGTRPEAVKLAPVVRAMRRRGTPVVLVATGQHRDLAPQMLKEVGLVPDVDLGVNQPGATPPQLLSAILIYLAPVFTAWRPRLAIVQGDTVSTLAGALAAAYARVPIAHVEAGLRTGDPAEPFPEELQRTLLAPLATLQFAPTDAAAAALQKQGVDPRRIHVTGNSGIDALNATLARIDGDPGLRASLEARFPFVAWPRRPLLLVTVHRRENSGQRLAAIGAALARLAGFCETDILLPLHPNPDVQTELRRRLEGLDGVHIVPPVEHAAMVWLMQHARLLLTDSGGLQEEAPSLGLRTLVLRQATERQEAIDIGASELVPLSSDAIVAAVRRCLTLPAFAPVHPFGDGRASDRIAGIVADWLADPVAQPAEALAQPLP